jgi:hypothetical protein
LLWRFFGRGVTEKRFCGAKTFGVPGGATIKGSAWDGGGEMRPPFENQKKILFKLLGILVIFLYIDTG